MNADNTRPAALQQGGKPTTWPKPQRCCWSSLRVQADKIATKQRGSSEEAANQQQRIIDEAATKQAATKQQISSSFQTIWTTGATRAVPMEVVVCIIKMVLERFCVSSIVSASPPGAAAVAGPGVRATCRRTCAPALSDQRSSSPSHYGTAVPGAHSAQCARAQAKTGRVAACGAFRSERF